MDIDRRTMLGQERSEGDRQGVLAHLRKDGYHEPSLYDITEAFYRTAPK